jgi:hypothetical protein
VRHTLRLAVTSVLVGALLSACGSGGSSSTSASASESTSLDAFAEARKKPKPTDPIVDPAPAPAPEPTPPPPEPTPPPPEPTPPPPEPTPTPTPDPTPTPAPANAITWGWLVQAAANSSGGITKTAGGNWYGAGTSMQTLAASGVLEFAVNNVGSNPTVNASRVCLDSGVYDVNVPGSMDYCVVVGAGYASVYVHGAWNSDTAVAITDTLGIVVDGSTIRFTKNGTAFYTTGDTVAFPLAAVWTSNFDGYGLTSATLLQTGTAAPAPAPTPTPAAGTTATISWDPIVERTDGTVPSRVAGYRVFYGKDAENFDQWVDIRDPAILSAQFTGMSPGTWYFQVVALDADGYESAPADVLSYEFR